MASDLKINIQPTGIQSAIPYSGKNRNQVFMGRRHQQPAADKVEISDSHKRKNNVLKAVCIGLGLAAITVAGALLMTKGKTNMTKKLAQQFEEDVALLRKFKTHKSENAGATVQETITNILGKDSKIKPHNYDTTQEYPVISVWRNFGGYRQGLVSKDGILDIKSSTDLPMITGGVIHYVPEGGHVYPTNCGAYITEGTVGQYPNRVVSLTLPDRNSTYPSPIPMSISFISPNTELTPLQKDVIKLAEHLDNKDLDVFDKIVKWKNSLDENGHTIPDLTGKYENLDYDLILSAIQSMAN